MTHISNNMASIRKIQRQNGMTFIEVIIAMVILVVGILGAVAMQASAKKGSFDAMQRSIASALAQDILERMRSNNAGALNVYNGLTFGQVIPENAPNPRCDSAAALCNPGQMATADLYEWEINLLGADVTNDGENTGGLVGALACIQHINNAVVVVISWEGREAISDGAANNIAFAKNCGTSTDKRRQIVVNGFIF